MKRHWPEYAMEMAGLACFMAAAVVITTTVEHPASPLRAAVPSAIARRALIGVGMGLTAAALIYSPWGRRSGAHLNPAVTLSYLRLGKVGLADAGFYVAAQFAGAALGLGAAAALLRGAAANAAVHYVATVPGVAGAAAAFGAELAISFGMMTTILAVSNTPRAAHFTGAIAACLIAAYITIEAPLSGMSMNPARTFAPAIAAGASRFLWIYFIAPPLGMLLAAETYLRRHGAAAVRCAKLHHPAAGPCHFNCGKAV
ncbi:MAG TPA: aquaporin [Vicinamibacterales bacterium]|nr:aquaporin [Vicinamibacterales bacterium]